jgi:hypothetical protein
MDDRQFDDLVRTLSRSRRSVLGLGAALGVAPLVAEARKKKKKVKLCLNGQTISVPKKKRGAYFNQGATAGACSTTPCARSCAGKPCGAGDGCGGTCDCPAGQICGNGACHACDVTCTGADPTACGAALQARLDEGGIVYACPGRYLGTYFLWNSVTIYGAGQGDDPAANTILDGNQLGRVFVTDVDITVTVENVRITGGKRNNGAGGVVNNGTLSMRRCTVTGNVVTGTSGHGAGVRQTAEATGSLSLTDCAITNNESDNYGAGIAQANVTHPVTLANCVVSGNRAGISGLGNGGGLFCFEGSVQITGGSFTHNRAVDGGGIAVTTSGTVTLDGVAFSANTPNNCIGMAGCPA